MKQGHIDTGAHRQTHRAHGQTQGHIDTHRDTGTQAHSDTGTQ